MPKLDPVARSPEGASGLACDRRSSTVCHLGDREEGARAIFTPGDGGACTNGVGGRGPASDNIGRKPRQRARRRVSRGNDAEEKSREDEARAASTRDATRDRRTLVRRRSRRTSGLRCSPFRRANGRVWCRAGCVTGSSAGTAMMGESCERSPISVFPAICSMTWHVGRRFRPSVEGLNRPILEPITGDGSKSGFDTRVDFLSRDSSTRTRRAIRWSGFPRT